MFGILRGLYIAINNEIKRYSENGEGEKLSSLPTLCDVSCSWQATGGKLGVTRWIRSDVNFVLKLLSLQQNWIKFYISL